VGLSLRVRALVLTTIAIVSLAFIVVAFFFFLWVSKLDTRLSRLALADARIPVTVTVFGAGPIPSARESPSTPPAASSWDGRAVMGGLGAWRRLRARPGLGRLGRLSLLRHTDETGDRRGVALFRHYDRAGFPRSTSRRNSPPPSVFSPRSLHPG
jgi:hypothetical protein